MRREDRHMVGKLLWKIEGLMVKSLNGIHDHSFARFFWNGIIALMSVQRTYNVMNVGINLSVTQYTMGLNIPTWHHCKLLNFPKHCVPVDNISYYIMKTRWHEWAVNMSTWYNHLQPGSCHPMLIITVRCWH